MLPLSRRRTNWDDIFEKDFMKDPFAVRPERDRGHMLDMEDDPTYDNAQNVNTEPKPYHYGLVGSANSRSPPSMEAGLPSIGSHSTELGAAGAGAGAVVAGAMAGAGASDTRTNMHNRTPSETPLMLNVRPGSSNGRGGQGQGGAHLTPSSSGLASISRPSTGGSLSGTGTGSGTGPLGVEINTGPSLSLSGHGTETDEITADSPTSYVAPQRTLFITNQTDDPASHGYASPVGSPRAMSPVSASSGLGSPTSPYGSSAGGGAGPSSFAGAMVGMSNAPSAYPSAAQEKRRLRSMDNVSVTTAPSVYSQASATRSTYARFESGGGGEAVPPLPSLQQGQGQQRATSPQSALSTSSRSNSDLAYLRGDAGGDGVRAKSPQSISAQQRHLGSNAFIHEDAGRPSEDAPPAYED